VVDRGTVRHDEVRAERWVVRGISKVAGDVDVGVADLGGTVVIGGAVAARDLSVRGSLATRGSVAIGGRLRARGSVEATAPLRAHEARLEGSVRASAEVAAETTLVVRGSLRAASASCRTLDLRGTATVPGTVAAPVFRARLVGDSAFGLIQGRDIRLCGPSPNVVTRTLGEEQVVTAERIEAETVYVEAARVRFVRANEVVLGRNAHVVAVEGRVARAHRSSRLGPESWSRPPAGLSR